MSKLTLRRLGIVLGLALIAGAIFLSRFLSQQKEPPRKKAVIKQERTVDTMHVYNSNIATTLQVQGELAAYDKIDIFAEVSGTLQETSRPFKVGSYFPKGSVLLKVDDTEARLNLQAQKSSLLNALTQLMPDLKVDYPESFENWKTYIDQFDPEQPIKALPDPASEQEKYFVASRNLQSQYYNIKSAEERLSKYRIFAPFSGVLTEAAIHPGAVVRAGQRLGVLMNTKDYELEATVPLSELSYIQVGNTVKLLSDDIDGNWTGRVRRINDQVDPGTQTVKVFISVGGQKLREGMYLKGDIAATSIKNAISLPRDLLVDQKAVYEVKDSVLQLREIKVVKITEDAAVIRGVKDGASLLKNPVPGAFDGMKVRIAKKPDAPNPTTGESTGNTAVSSM